MTDKNKIIGLPFELTPEQKEIFEKHKKLLEERFEKEMISHFNSKIDEKYKKQPLRIQYFSKYPHIDKKANIIITDIS